MNIFSIDLEDWFHIIGTSENDNYKNWYKFNSRVEHNTEILLNLLSKYNIKATFFILGWIAQKYPSLIKKISDNGHDFGFHTQWHKPLNKLNKNKIEEDIFLGKKNIENIIGKSLTYFRAPGFSISNNDLWIFEILRDNNFLIDSSLFIGNHGHGGFKSEIYNEPFLIKLKEQKEIIEFPIVPFKNAFFNIPFSGGGYFRFFPYYFLYYALRKKKYSMFYIHPRDIDPHQPKIKNLNFMRNFKSYVGLNNSKKKLECLMLNIEWLNISQALKIINKEKLKTMNIN